MRGNIHKPIHGEEATQRGQGGIAKWRISWDIRRNSSFSRSRDGKLDLQRRGTFHSPDLLGACLRLWKATTPKLGQTEMASAGPGSNGERDEATYGGWRTIGTGLHEAAAPSRL
ncbi:hypothetical protein CC1G_15261 [Coprinopsis cinerea okayama7|uniref:Uncharacterized protein n=1 Tax=Coprinopsis cinerea (strain Okayama-7 / 130 / ATCC MYA-4618 / FGSC 9003) TaxID=240176 RepID=D6RPW0_COPC7|nr:hypothetical protein CC1G_15261 [Coprinopsis cinerea okayama7\|eukprot:XP_002910353.1 hypothetical protein CC1G_15261 [Coprinopsis cinerea okayama7\